MGTITESFIKIANSCNGFSTKELLAAIGGLQLMPENGNQIFRLEMLAHVVASCPYDQTGNKQRLSTGKLRTLCNTDVIAGIVAAQEDPNPNPLTCSINFYGGSYIAFPGISSHPTQTLQLLIHSLFFKNDAFDKEFIARCYNTIRCVLIIGDAIAQKAGLGRGIEIQGIHGGKVVIPTVDEVSRLSRCTTFTKEEINQLATTRYFEIETIEALICEAGGVDLSLLNFEQGELFARPMVRCGEDLVVPLPSMILPAIRHLIIRMVKEYEQVDAFIANFNYFTWNNMQRSHDFLGHKKLSLSLTNPKPSNFIDDFFSIDVDKTLYSILITDDLQGYDPGYVFGSWDIKGVKPLILQRIQEAKEYHDKEIRHSQSLIIMISFMPLGRDVILGLEQDEIHEEDLFLSFSPPELEIIAFNEIDNALVLWKFACAKRRFEKKKTIIQSFGALAEFEWYHDHQCSYYISDDYLPNIILIPFESGIELRKRMDSKTDIHTVLSSDASEHVEVVLARGDIRLPIYTPLGNLQSNDGIGIYIEATNIPIWIISPPHKIISEHNLVHQYLIMADVIAYWLCLFGKDLKILTSSSNNKKKLLPHIVIHLSLPESESWHQTNYEQELKVPQISQQPVEVRVSLNGDEVRLVIHASLLQMSAIPTNEGERVLMKCVLEALQHLGRIDLSDVEIKNFIDEKMPISNKKMLLTMRSPRAFDLDDSGLPKFRAVQDADQEEILDDIGEQLCEVAKLSRGIIPSQNRAEVLNKYVVGFLYEELQKLVALLNPDSLVENLVAYHESNLQAGKEIRFTIPTRLACFNFDNDMPARIEKEFGDTTASAMGNRFLLEYVVAQPPSGTQSLSIAMYDRLVALAYEIANLGFLSDIIQYGLANIELSVLKSGRLGRDMATYKKVDREYRSLFVADYFSDAHKTFGDFWENFSQESVKASEEEIKASPEENAMYAEFGFSMTEILNFASFLLEKAHQSEGQVAIIPYEQLTNEMQYGATLVFLDFCTVRAFVVGDFA
jgi:hypothetical protein